MSKEQNIMLRMNLMIWVSCSLVISDGEIPQLMCPDNVMNSTSPGLATGIAFWPAASVTDNSMLPITPVANATSGSAFGIGKHIVQFTATDASGNSNNCTFNVTIEGRVIWGALCEGKRPLFTDSCMYGFEYSFLFWHHGISCNTTPLSAKQYLKHKLSQSESRVDDGNWIWQKYVWQKWRKIQFKITMEVFC